MASDIGGTISWLYENANNMLEQSCMMTVNCPTVDDETLIILECSDLFVIEDWPPLMF